MTESLALKVAEAIYRRDRCLKPEHDLDYWAMLVIKEWAAVILKEVDQ